MGNILINKNYGNNFTVQAGATVVAGGPGAAMMREKMFASQEEEAGTQDLVTTDDGSTQGTDVDGSNHFGFEAWALKPTEERMKSWKIFGAPENENVIANSVGKRFLSLYRKGQ